MQTLQGAGAGTAPHKKTRPLGRWLRRNYTAYLFLLPFLLLFFLFTIVPVFISFIMSFTEYDMFSAPVFVGIANYSDLLLDDEIFLLSLKNTFLFAAISGPVGFLMSFFVAWIINSLKCKNLFALAFYTPSITSAVAMSVIWMYFFSGDRYGLINNLLIRLGVLSKPILWLLNENTIPAVVIFVSVWMSMGTGFLVFMAGLQNVNREYYEAGAIDGIRSRFQELWYITLPIVKPQLLFGAINAVVGAFSVFDTAVAIAGMPSPNYAAHTIVAHLFDYAFIRFQMGYASAVAMVLFFITFVLGQILMKLLGSKD